MRPRWLATETSEPVIYSACALELPAIAMWDYQTAYYCCCAACQRPPSQESTGGLRQAHLPLEQFDSPTKDSADVFGMFIVPIFFFFQLFFSFPKYLLVSKVRVYLKNY